jgi:hypothetical protein
VDGVGWGVGGAEPPPPPPPSALTRAHTHTHVPCTEKETHPLYTNNNITKHKQELAHAKGRLDEETPLHLACAEVKIILIMINWLIIINGMGGRRCLDGWMDGWMGRVMGGCGEGGGWIHHLHRCTDTSTSLI